jgi:hypothetical protein
MNILRAILVSLAGFICVIAISGFVSLSALHSTIMDRAVVKDWFTTSKIYDGRLVSALVQTTDTNSEQGSSLNPQSQAGIRTSPEAVRTALKATFTPDFVQPQIEGVINNAYDWVEGKTPEFKFSIPISQKRDTFIQQLAKAIEPQIAALPVCQPTRQIQQSTCRPRNVTAEQFATQLATQNIDDSGAFAQPITNESITKGTQKNPHQTSSAPLAQLPAVRAGIDMLLIILPIVAIIGIATVTLATASGRRLVASSRLSRRIFFSMLLTFIPAIAVVWLARNSDLGLSNMFSSQIGDVATTLIKTIVVGLSTKLALFSGIACLISVLAWIGFTIWRRKLQAIEAARTPGPMLPVEPVQTSQQPQSYI